MYGLWNELFWFPVNDCDYEGLKCDKRYIPVLNRDRDNEFVWGLMDPFGWMDAHDISFNTISPDWNPRVDNVADALNSLQEQVIAITNHTEIKSFTLAVTSDSTVTGRLVFVDKQGTERTFEGSFNIKDIVESIDFENLSVDNLKVNETFVSDGTSEFNGLSEFNDNVDIQWALNVEGATTTKGITNTGDIITDSIHSETGEIKTLVSDDVTVNDSLNVIGSTTTNGITNTGTIDTDNITSDTGTITDLTSDNVTVNTKLESLGDTVTNGITNTGIIDTDNITSDAGTITTLSSDNVTVNTKLESLGDTVTNGIENTGKITTTDIETETAKVTTKLEVTGATVTNGITNNGLMETTDALVNNNLVVDGNTDLQTLEVNGAANFREDVKIFDDFYVSGDTLLNGELKVNWPETHNGDITYNGDVVFNGTITADGLDVDLTDYQKKEEKGRPNGYASLDTSGKVPMSQLPDMGGGGIHYVGAWNPNSGYPSNPTNGDMYQANQNGTAGGVNYVRGDRIIWSSNDNIWNKLDDNYGVSSVNGRTGNVVDVQDTYDRKNVIDLVNPDTTKYLSEKAVADLINPLIQRIQDLEQENAKTTIATLDSTSGLPASMNEGQSYTVPFQNLRSTDHVIILDTVTNGNIVITPGNGQISIVSSANETNPVVNVLVIKGE